HRDAHQDELGRHHRLQVGVAGAGEQLVAAVQQQVVPVQVVVERQYQHEDACGDRQLDTGGVGQLTAPSGQADPAEEVLQDHGTDASDDQRAGPPSDPPAG